MHLIVKHSLAGLVALPGRFLKTFLLPAVLALTVAACGQSEAPSDEQILAWLHSAPYQNWAAGQHQTFASSEPISAKLMAHSADPKYGAEAGETLLVVRSTLRLKYDLFDEHYGKTATAGDEHPIYFLLFAKYEDGDWQLSRIEGGDWKDDFAEEFGFKFEPDLPFYNWSGTPKQPTSK